MKKKENYTASWVQESRAVSVDMKNENIAIVILLVIV
jgi:hypothetical protein